MSLALSCTKSKIVEIVDRQLEFFGLDATVEPYVDDAFDRMEVAFKKITNKYYHLGGGTAYFSASHSGQYMQLLYYLSRFAFLDGKIEMADNLFSLNKMLNAIDLFYEVELTGAFFTDHPMGCVLGRAIYNDCFAFSNGCVIGGNHDVYPVIGKNVEMHAMSMIVGNSHIGNNVEISAFAFVRDTDIPDNSIVFGQSPHLSIVTKNSDYMKERLRQFKYE